MNILIRALYSILLLMVPLSLCGQSGNDLLISGNIRDKDSREPLPFASVSLSHHPVGTIANEAGEFSMSIDENFRHDTLVVSFVGYAKYLCPLSLIQSRKHLEVNLTAQATMLREILVNAAALDGNQIMAKAIESIGRNYPSGPFLMEGFFREMLRQDTMYVHLTEAALNVYDKNFQRRLNHGITEEVSLIESRECINYADPVIRSVRKQNSVMDLLDNNPVHYTRGLLNTKYFDYRIDSIIHTQDEVVYVIGTIPGRHQIYVSESDFAILKTIEEIQEADTVKRPEFNLDEALSVRRIVYFKAISEFQEYDGKWYLKYSNELDAYEILDRKSGRREFLVESFKEFVVTKLVTKHVRPFKKEEKYDFRKDVAHRKYNPAFWQNNTIQLSPLNMKVRRDLEKEMPLTQQFSKVKGTDETGLKK